MTGIGPVVGINAWTFPGADPTFGRLGSWGRAGSMHPGGCQFDRADGSAREAVYGGYPTAARMADGATLDLD